VTASATDEPPGHPRETTAGATSRVTRVLPTSRTAAAARSAGQPDAARAPGLSPGLVSGRVGTLAAWPAGLSPPCSPPAGRLEDPPERCDPRQVRFPDTSWGILPTSVAHADPNPGGIPHVQPCHLFPLRQGHLDRLRAARRPGDGRRPDRPALLLPLSLAGVDPDQGPPPSLVGTATRQLSFAGIVASIESVLHHSLQPHQVHPAHRRHPPRRSRQPSQ
jgi:hypothetical protein